jgi:hypothetical protein
MKKTCFGIMPFADGFEDIDQIVAKAARRCGLAYVRGDRRAQPGSILPQVLRDIRQAAVVVADITGHNPNVFYELGIAHQIKGPDQVVIITQTLDEKKAYDVHQFRQLVYAHNSPGRAKLLKELPSRLRKAMEASAHEESWNVIRGRLPRTRMLVRELKRIVADVGPTGLRGTTIRIAAGLSSLAISDHEPPDPKLGGEYVEALLEERNALRITLLHGARLKAVLNPPRRFAQAMMPQRLRARYRRLIGLFEGHSDIRGNPKAAREDVRAMQQCEFALSPVPMPNIFIIGNEVAYEGMKRAGTAGFDMTHCETSADGVRELVEQFDNYFEQSLEDMIQNHPPDGQLAEQLRQFYENAGREGRIPTK